jgi:pimeloyl-ACP methyl ester carboxylesterase
MCDRRVGYTREQQMADAVALLDRLGLDRVRLIGHDAGTILGYTLCLIHPERVHSFVATGAPHPFARFHPRMLQGGWRLWFQPVIAMPVLGPAALRSGHQRLPRYLFQQFTAPGFTCGKTTWRPSWDGCAIRPAPAPGRPSIASSSCRSSGAYSAAGTTTSA